MEEEAFLPSRFAGLIWVLDRTHGLDDDQFHAPLEIVN